MRARGLQIRWLQLRAGLGGVGRTLHVGSVRTHHVQGSVLGSQKALFQLPSPLRCEVRHLTMYR